MRFSRAALAWENQGSPADVLLDACTLKTAITRIKLGLKATASTSVSQTAHTFKQTGKDGPPVSSMNESSCSW